MADVEVLHSKEESIINSESKSDTEEKKDEKSSPKKEQVNDEELQNKIIKQIEYYFGDSNLSRDKFLQEQISKDDGWVPLSVLLTFNRLSKLSEDPKFIVDSLDKSDEGLIEIHESREKIRRHPERPLPEQNEEHRKEIISRTAYVKGFPPKETEMSDLIDFFNPYEKVVHICMRKYHDKQTKQYLFKGSVFVTFSKKEECQEFLKKDKIEYNGTELIRKWQEEYIEEKKNEKTARESKRNKNKEPEFALPVGTVILLEGFTKETPREQIKEVLSELGGDVAYIEYNKGDSKAYVRLSEENSAKVLFEKFEDGKIKINDEELTAKVLEGDEEKEFLENVIKSMAQKRQHSNRGRRGGGGRHQQNRKRKGDDDNDGPPAKH